MEIRANNLINVLTCGFGSSSHTYLLGACERIMKKAGILKGSSDDVLVWQDDILGVFDKKYKSFSVADAMSKFNVIGSHDNLLFWYNSVAWEYFEKVLYVHRDIRDCMVVITKYHCISDIEDYESTKYKYIERNDLKTFMNRGNPLRYNILYTDMRHYPPWIIDHLKAWRKHIIGFLKVKEANQKVHEFKYYERKQDEEKDIQKIINILGVDLSIKKYSELIVEFAEAGYEDCHPKEKKIGGYLEYFDNDEIRLMNSEAGDALCVMNYMSLDEYSPFIKNNESFAVVVIDEDSEFVEDTIYLLRRLGKDIKSVSIVSKKSSGNLGLAKDEKHLLFSRDILYGISLMKEKGLIEGENFILYPYYEMYRSYPVKLFNINKRYKTTISSLTNDYKSGIIIHDDNDYTINIVLPAFGRNTDNKEEKKYYALPEYECNLTELERTVSKYLQTIDNPMPFILLSITDLKLLSSYLRKLKPYYSELYAISPMYDADKENPYLKRIKEIWGPTIEAEEVLEDKIISSYYEGKSLLQQENYTEAEKKLKDALSLEPHDRNTKASILFTLGNLYLQQQRYSESEEEYKNALSKKPWDKNIKANILINLANLYFRQKRRKEAEIKIMEAISIGPPNRNIINPILIEEGFKGYNIVRYRGRFYGMAQSLGPLDLTKVGEEILKSYEQDGYCIIGNTVIEVKYLVDKKAKSCESQ